MDFRPSPEHIMVVESARGQLRRDLAPFKPGGRVISDPPGAARAVWKSACEQGWLGIMVPEELGGLAMGAIGAALFFEEIGRANAPGPFLANAALIPAIVASQPANSASGTLLDGVIEGGNVFGLGLTGGDDRESVIVENHGLASDVIFLREVPGEARELVVQTASLGEAPAHPQPLLDIYADAAVSRSWTWAMHFALPLQALAPFSVAVSAEILGIAAQALEDTVAYVKERQQFGVPIGSFQAVKHQLADCYVKVENARTSIYYAAMCLDGSKPEQHVAVDLARTYCGSIATEVLHTCIQMHGGFGYTWESGLHVGLRRIHHLNSYLRSHAAAAESLGDAVLSGEIDKLA